MSTGGRVSSRRGEGRTGSSSRDWAPETAATPNPEDAAALERVRAAYSDTRNPAWIRDRAEISGWFDDLELLSPGVVHQPQWRAAAEPPADVDAARIGSFNWCGVGEVR